MEELRQGLITCIILVPTACLVPKISRVSLKDWGSDVVFWFDAGYVRHHSPLPVLFCSYFARSSFCIQVVCSLVGTLL